MSKDRTVCVPVILSGGMGTRLWPMSRGSHPKQFLNLNNPALSLIQETALRVADRSHFAAPVIVCNEQHRFLVAEKMQELGIKDAAIMLEPIGRNTAPALTAAAHYVRDHYGENALMLVLPSDHIITNNAAFLKGVSHACETASQGYLTTFGITPHAPETGYGYIKYGKAIGKSGSYQVAAFVEKPDAKTAKQYLASGEYVWNSGMFCFPVGLFLSEITALQPQMSALAEQAAIGREEGADFVRLSADAFSRIKSDSIDYALMERTQKAAVLPMDCGWSDAGSFDALWDVKPKDENDNVVSGETYLQDTRGCFITCNDGVQVATLGVENLVIISTKDCIMVADKSRAQEVKDLVDAIKLRNVNLIENHRQISRPWGNYDSIDNGARYQVKRIVVKPGAKLSLQMHYHRAEHWIVVSGTAIVTYGETKEVLTENQSVYIPYGTVHRLENPGKIPLELIEVQSGSYLGEDDIVRFEDTYGRSS
jgi:mannose-1-phosphate guanylyltransferase/mannose-6-phosphate isomerase